MLYRNNVNNLTNDLYSILYSYYMYCFPSDMYDYTSTFSMFVGLLALDLSILMH